jgi:ATP-dependent RNA helicase MSS116
MFNACRRGTASLCRVALSTSSAALPVTRSSVLSSKFLQSTKSTTSAIRYFHISPSAKWGVQAQEQEHSSADDITPEALPKGEIITKFTHLAENGHVHHHIIKEITETMGHETMTQVQALTIDETLKGTDV